MSAWQRFYEEGKAFKVFVSPQGYAIQKCILLQQNSDGYFNC